MRVVVASEANVNRQIDEARIKTMTGNEPLVARFMRQNEFQLMPEFKLVLIANNFPRVRHKDNAFGRVPRHPHQQYRAEGPNRFDLLDKLLSRVPLDPRLGGPGLPIVAEARASHAGGRPGHDGALEDYRRRRATLRHGLLRVGAGRTGLGLGALQRVSGLLYRKQSRKTRRPPAASGRAIEFDLTPRHTRAGNVWDGIPAQGGRRARLTLGVALSAPATSLRETSPGAGERSRWCRARSERGEHVGRRPRKGARYRQDRKAAG